MENKNIRVDVTYADGSRRRAVISSSVLSLVKRFARLTPSLFEGTGFNPLSADASNIVAVTRADHDALHQFDSAVRKADFRLGQLDMQASVCDMLRDMAKKNKGVVKASLNLAADLVESMEVPDANS